MSDIVRFGVSLEKELLEKFDRLITEKSYPNRSEAIRDLIRENLVKKEWTEGKEVAGSITLVFNHHKRELMNTLTDIQHDFHHLIISSQHIHLDHDNCLEIIVVKGKPEETKELTNKLRSTKGVKYGALSIATTGKGLV
ncbi:MAG: nickel-responsive transcriptional regulator NikR [Candidatus Atribacteria bacterium]|nr:nickel-responsive transcriptional regulator NikR [Candidatus Atribacteria bacterium]